MERDVDDQRNIGVTPVEKILEHDGMSFLKGIIDGSLPRAPISDTLGFDIVEVETGRAVFECVPDFKHYNPIGTVHGGLAMTLLDSCMSCAIQTTLARGELYTTLEVKVNLVRAITKDTGLIRATGRLIHRGRTTGTSEGDIRDAAGNLFAHGTTTCVIFPAKTGATK
jgi:uncharacterized protein (TIGR00369 family)